MDKKLRKQPKDKATGLPKKYVPKGLSKEDKANYVKEVAINNVDINAVN